MNISPSELIIMDVLWETNEPLTSSMVYDRINAIYPDKWQYHTIVTFLSRLVQKKAAKYNVEGRNYLYYSNVERDAYFKKYINEKFDKHHIDSSVAFIGLLGEKYTKENIDAAKKLLEEYKKK